MTPDSSPAHGRGRLFTLVAMMVVIALLLAEGRAWAKQTYTLSEGGWRQEAAVEPDSPAGRLQAAQRTLAQGEAGRALAMVKAWIEKHPNHPLAPEAYLLKADAQVAGQSFYNALFDYEHLVRAYPAAQQYMTALEREYEIARLFVRGLNRRFLGFRLLPAQGEGEELLIRIQERAPGSEIGERASLLLADYYYTDGQMGLAAQAYDLFLQNYPDSPQREWAMLRVIQANLARFQGPAFDQAGLLEARQRLKQYAKVYPAAADRINADKLLVRINESLAQRDLLSAKWYAKRGEDVSVVFLLRRLIQDYPDTTAAKRAVQRLRSRGEAVVLVPAKARALANQPARAPAP